MGAVFNKIQSVAESVLGILPIGVSNKVNLIKHLLVVEL